ncbi:hypothetical protein BH789_gp047 [Gordonia phage GMA6]|uniref:Uncharacterized protein n=1 Tax=Gordonia phage GMA6 TaxID=1647285 RepID=A0A0K0NL69_9CAUD|nr:hypothetical protein BH789_gp047 [Gordonia phage GMA6]AKL88328.1 hypothetical protein GMA6_47 [Gordonia phage GMA6]
MSTEEIARVVAAALNEFDGSPDWESLDERSQQIIMHGVRVIQEGNDESELYRQTAAAEIGDASIDTSREWAKLAPLDRRRWFLFAAVVRSLSTEQELFDVEPR